MEIIQCSANLKEENTLNFEHIYLVIATPFTPLHGLEPYLSQVHSRMKIILI